MCRLIARVTTDGKKQQPMSAKEIAKASGLSKRTVDWLSLKDEWHHVTVDVMCRFREACGVTAQNQGKQLYYFTRSYLTSRRPLAHLGKRSMSPKFRKKLLGLG